jgi:DNA repair protein RAD50
VLCLGKTTLIECLKYACCGSAPPLSESGKSFVTDPRIAGVACVKAQIRLSFRTSDSKTILAIRSFQLTQKKEKREFKATESLLKTRIAQSEGGEKESTVSNKVSRNTHGRSAEKSS